MIDFVCKYIPVEILAGFDEVCVRYNPMPDDISLADNLAHSNMCSFSRSLIAARLQNSDRGLFLTNCCDSMRSANDALHNEGQTIFSLDLPHNSDHCGKLMYKNELLQFIAYFSDYSGRKFDCQKFRLAFETTAEGISGPYIGVMGARLPDELLAFIAEKSVLPICNNTCTGQRFFAQPPQTDDLDQLMTWYADQLLTQTPCVRMTDISSRKVLVNDPNLKGIIYNTVSFCDFYGFEYAQLKKVLSVPMLKIETDYTHQAMAQMQTRLSTFFEGFEQPIQNEHRVTIYPESSAEQYTVGIDSGSTSTNVVILDGRQRLVSSCVIPTGARVTESAQKSFGEALKLAGLSEKQITGTVATGYGRAKINFRDKDVTEITCHAKGAHFLNPAVRTVIDIGGQDSKVIRLDETGTVIDFIMNDKCAAGTGRFLEMMAYSLGLGIQEMSIHGLQWHEEITISSMCSVFAQSEVVSLIAEEKNLEDIIHGINMSVAAKVIALGKRSEMVGKYIMTGGVAKNRGVVKALEAKLGQTIIVPDIPDICGALGAALIAAHIQEL